VEPRGLEPLTPCLQNASDRGESLLQAFITERKSTKGLTTSGEDWLQRTLGRFIAWHDAPLANVERGQIVQFLALYVGKPWQRHSMYRALRTFWKWVSRTYDVANPMIDRWGNPVIDPPRVPSVILHTQTPESVAALIAFAYSPRDKAMIAVLADTGARRSELANIKVRDLDLDRQRIRVMGKGNKEGWLIFGEGTERFLETYLQEERPTGLLFGLTPYGVQTFFRRLEDRSGIKCNPHSFRRGFATELRRKGVSELDIAQLGRWSSLEMVRRYTKAYSFDDAAMRYRPMVD
jgi:site-specific recombinase XerD